MVMTKTKQMNAKALFATVMACFLTACQTVPTPSPSTPTETVAPIAFGVNGKIGIVTMVDNKRQANSAFYAWQQQDERFAIDLTGALGLGATNIRYDGQVATLTHDKITLTADTPEELLYKATGWHAPISHLPYWVLGRVAVGDTDSVFDGGRLIRSTNDQWTANFEYKDTRPSNIVMTHTDGHRVVMTINHTRTTP